MPHHTLGAGDGHGIGIDAEDFLTGLGFDFVINGRTRAVGVDVVDIGRIESGVLQEPY